MEDYKKWVMQWFHENALVEFEELDKNVAENYFDLGWIDSMKFMFFISAVEDEFDIEFSNDEFQNRDFGTIEGLVRIISNKKHG